MSEDANFTATLKGGAGYEAPWLVVRGDTADELVGHLDALTEDLLQKVNDVASLFRGAGAAAPVTSGQDATVTQSAPAGDSGNLRTCAHGVRVKRSGNGSKGPWTGYFCALPKGAPGACQVEWA